MADSFALAGRRFQHVGRTGLKMVFMTASKEFGLSQKAMSLGAASLVEEPFTADVLLSAIEEALAVEPPTVFG